MNLSNTRTFFAGLVLASALCAQTKTANYVRVYGPTDPVANVTIDLQAKVAKGVNLIKLGNFTFANPYASAHAHARASVNIGGWSGKALALEANGYSVQTGSSGSLKCTVAGIDFVNESHSGLYTWANAYGPHDLFDRDPEIPVPFTAGLVTVGANIGAGAEFTFVTSGSGVGPSLSVGGSGRVYGTGRVKVVAGLGGYGVVLSANLRFLDTTAAPYLSASATTLTGALNLSMTPLSIVLKAALVVPIAGTIMSKQIWSWTASTLSTSLTAL